MKRHHIAQCYVSLTDVRRNFKGKTITSAASTSSLESDISTDEAGEIAQVRPICCISIKCISIRYINSIKCFVDSGAADTKMCAKWANTAFSGWPWCWMCANPTGHRNRAGVWQSSGFWPTILPWIRCCGHWTIGQWSETRNNRRGCQNNTGKPYSLHINCISMNSTSIRSIFS